MVQETVIVIQIAAISAVSDTLGILRTDARKLLEDARANNRFDKMSTAQEQANAAMDVWKMIPEAFQNDIIANKKKKQLKDDAAIANKVTKEEQPNEAKKPRKRIPREPDLRVGICRCLGALLFFSG